MTHEEIADRIDAVLNDQDPHGTIDVEALERLRDELRPPRPEPGTVVWFPFDKSYGIVSPDGRGVYNHNGELLAWWEVESGTTPARILSPGQAVISKEFARAIAERLTDCGFKEWAGVIHGAIDDAEAGR